MDRKRLYLIDGMSYIYRAYYALPHFSTSRGIPTNAAYGFTSMLRKLIQEEKPDYIGVGFDVEGPTVRHEQFEAYKATRKPMPDELALQLPYIRKVCEVFHVPVIGCPGYEADDVLGTLSDKAAEQGLDVVLVTSDKDMFQLVSDHVFILDPMKNNTVYDRGKVIEKLGVPPEEVPDLLGLWGDSSDNIPGAPGIGAKGAVELIRTFGSIEGSLENWEKVKRKTYRESLRDHREQIRQSRELAVIRRDIPVDLDLDLLSARPPDRKAAFNLFSELEFKALMREFLQEEHGAPLRAERLSGADAVRFLDDLSGRPEMYFAMKFREGILGTRTCEAVCAAAERNRAGLIDLRDRELAEKWKQAMRGRARKICWDAKISLPDWDTQKGRMEDEVEDVMLMAFLTSPHVGDYTLRRWALDQLHVDLKDSGAATHTLLEPEREPAAGTLCRELDAVVELYELLDPQLDSLGLRSLYRDIEMPLVPVLAEMERTGIKLDPGKLQTLSAELEGQLATLTEQIYEIAGTEFNIQSPKQLGEILFGKLNLPTGRKMRKTKGFSTSQAVLEELAESYVLPRLVLEYRQLAKLKSTYADSLPALIRPETGRIHTSFSQTGAATGRLSSSNPNLQNIPIRTELGRRIREAFVPEPGCLLLSADYSQVELRVLAHLSGDEVLSEAFRRGEDIHDRTAREVFSASELENEAECRRRAKVINFGIVYGLSAFGLAQRLGIGNDEAQAFIDAYFARYRGVRAWLDRTIEEARRLGVVRTMFGRIRPIPDIHSRNYNIRQFAERTAVNTPIQGTAADIIKIAMVRTQRALNARALSSKILLQVHDELVLEVPEHEMDQVRALVTEEMENAASLDVPLRVEIGAGDSWVDAK